jgi:mersacidin/lichenicidin family type 2 lantibiotic
MSFDVIRAWKDEEYRLGLSDEERRHLPENPVGGLELTDADLEAVYGGGSISLNVSLSVSISL